MTLHTWIELKEKIEDMQEKLKAEQLPSNQDFEEVRHFIETIQQSPNYMAPNDLLDIQKSFSDLLDALVSQRQDLSSTIEQKVRTRKAIKMYHPF